jgi:hypothetical protein
MCVKADPDLSCNLSFIQMSAKSCLQQQNKDH